MSLATIREEFGSKIAMLAAHAKNLDRKVLAERTPDMADEEPRERLFDVLMRRLEAMAGERAAIRSLLRSAMIDPPLALALNSITVRSQQWMLAAAGIDAAGPGGMVRARGSLFFIRGCCEHSSTMTTTTPAPWRRSTASSTEAGGSCACSTVCVG